MTDEEKHRAAIKALVGDIAAVEYAGKMNAIVVGWLDKDGNMCCRSQNLTLDNIRVLGMVEVLRHAVLEMAIKNSVIPTPKDLI